MTTKITDKNISNIANKFIQWQSVITADGSTSTNATAGQGYFIDTTSATHTITLPSSPSIGNSIAIKDYAGTFATNNLTIARNGSNIQGVANDSLISSNRASLTLVYVDSTRGWVYSKESNVADLQQALFVTATGGTVTESSDYKIHTFTGDGCFVVSCGGNPSGSVSVDYLVVAGGGGGGSDAGGGGGAGGYRESSGAASGCYTVSPLGACVAALPVSVTTYPVTVGGGGGSNTIGSNSIFSTITSAGGGTGNGSPPTTFRNGGSAGGGRYSDPGGTGNTPPVSPPQGNSGGNSIPPFGFFGGGGGGGATASGSTTTPSGAGNGGAGGTSSINGTPTARAGGGGGGGGAPGGSTVAGSGAAGGGNGSPGYNPSNDGFPATINTGSGGGAGGDGAAPKVGGAGGSGIVIIRYKFQ